MPIGSTSYIAEGTIIVARFVKTGSGDFSVLQADANAEIIGVSQEGGREAPIPSVTADPVQAAIAADTLVVHEEGDCMIEAGGTIAVNDRLKADAAGAAVAIATSGTTIQNIGAVALEGGADGDRIRVRITRYSERPALS